MRNQVSGYSIFVHNPDGDMGFGIIAGKFRTAEAAEAKAETIRKMAGDRVIEAIVLPVTPGNTATERIINHVLG